jgi:glycosyltransferase involved in cell wall biosynthesis
MANMKLLICTQVVDKNDPILGFFQGWIEEFAKHFDHVHVICLREGVHTLPPNVTVYSLGKESGENRGKYFLRFYRYFAKIFFGERPNFVFFHMGAIYNILASPFFIFRKFFNTKFYWWKAHGHINWAGRLASRFTDSIYTASDRSFPLDSGKKRIVGHAIEVTETSLNNKEHGTLLRIGCIGRITRVKNIHIVIEVAHLLQVKGIHFKVTLVGQVVDMEYFKELEILIEKYALTEHIKFAGPIPHQQLSSVYEGIDVLLHPSGTGSIDKVVLEAMSEGAVPVALKSAYGDIISKFGLCVEDNTPGEYSQILEKIMHMSKAEYSSLREELHREIRMNHALSTITHRIFDI